MRASVFYILSSTFSFASLFPKLTSSEMATTPDACRRSGVRIPVPPHQSLEPKHPHTPPPGRKDASRVPSPQKGPCGMVYAEGRAPGMTKNPRYYLLRLCTNTFFRRSAFATPRPWCARTSTSCRTEPCSSGWGRGTTSSWSGRRRQNVCFEEEKKGCDAILFTMLCSEKRKNTGNFCTAVRLRMLPWCMGVLISVYCLQCPHLVGQGGGGLPMG